MKMNLQGFLSDSRFRQNLVVLLWAILIALIASFPYIYGFLREDEIFGVYLGRSAVNSADTYIFLSHIESVKQGEILLPNLYSSDPRDAYFVKPIYIVLGLVARIFNLNSLLVFHVSRFILSVLLMFTIWVLLGLILFKFRDKFLALVLVSTSTGLGALLKDKLPASIDLWVPEANTFFSTTEAPHFIWSQIGILILMITLLKFHSTQKVILLVIGSVVSALVVLEHPYLIPFLLLFPTLFLIISSDNMRAFLINCTAVVALPFFVSLLLYISYQNSSGLSLYSKQVILLTPPVINLISGYGLLIPLAIYGIVKGKTSDSSKYLLIIWASYLLLLINMPLPFQRRLLEGLHLPIAISASLALIRWNLKTNFVKLLLIGILGFLSITNVYQIKYAIDDIASDTSDSYSHHIYKEDSEGLLWIRDNSQPQDLILANFYYSNIIPGITGRYVYNGHLFNTIDSRNKSILFDNFMGNFESEKRSKFLYANRINYIFLGKNDPYREFEDSLASEEFLEVIWGKNGVTLFKVL